MSVASQECNDLDENTEFLKSKKQGERNVLWLIKQLKGNVYLKSSHEYIPQTDDEIIRKQ